MLMPSIFGENLFDDFFTGFPFYDDCEMQNVEKKLYGKHADRVMKTDIKELDDGYELEIDLPGFTKDEVKASLENGYLTISAAKGLDKDEKEKKTGHYIRKERYAGACSRSFYVGEAVKQADIKGEFKHGILKMFVRNCSVPSQLRCKIHENRLRRWDFAHLNHVLTPSAVNASGCTEQLRLFLKWKQNRQ